MEFTSDDQSLISYEERFLGRHIPRQQSNPLWNEIADRLGDMSSVYLGRPDFQGTYSLGVKTRASFATYGAAWMLSDVLHGAETRSVWVWVFGELARQAHKAVYRVARQRKRRGLSPVF